MPLPAIGFVVAPSILKGAVAASHGVLVLLKGIVCLVKVCNVVEAGYDIHTTIQSNEFSSTEKVHRVATSALFVATQTMDVGVDLASGVSSAVKLGARVGVGIADVSRKVSQKVVQDECDFSDAFDIASTAAFRVADVASLAANLYPQQYGDLNYPADLLQTGAVLAANRHTLINAKTSVENLLWRRRSLHTNTLTTISIDEKYKREVLEVLQANEIATFKAIPKFFLEDEELKKWICPITEKPIRYISVIQTTIDSDRPFWYEKSAISEWINKYPQRLPSQWPVEISLRQSKLVDYTSVQKMIDKRLLELFNELRALADEGAFTFVEQPV